MRVPRALQVFIAGGAAVGTLSGWLLIGQPRGAARWLGAHSHRVLFAVATARREVALTFDDGPHPHLTPALVNVLARHGAHATFFLLGSRAAEQPQLVQDLVLRGHEVGNHMWVDHPSVLQAAEAFERDLVRTDRVLRTAGAEPTFVRPGSGWIRPSMLRAATRHKCRLALGSVSIQDLALPDLDRAERFVLRRIQPGAVVVLHEGYDSRSRVVSLTDALLPALRRRGYRAVTLSALVDRADLPSTV